MKQRDVTILFGILIVVSFCMGHACVKVHAFWTEPVILWVECTITKSQVYADFISRIICHLIKATMFESLYIVKKNVKYHQEKENESVKIPQFKAGTSRLQGRHFRQFPSAAFCFITRTINLFTLVRYKEI